MNQAFPLDGEGGAKGDGWGGTLWTSENSISSNKNKAAFHKSDLVFSQNPAIVAWFSRGYADEQKANKKSVQNVLMS